MDEYLYYPTLILILIQIVGSGAVLIGGVVEFARRSSRQEYRGQKRMSGLNHLAFNGFSFLVGVVLLQLLFGGEVNTLLLLLASSFTELLAVAINYFYQKRVPSPDQLEATNCSALLDEADKIFRQNRPDEHTTREK